MHNDPEFNEERNQRPKDSCSTWKLLVVELTFLFYVVMNYEYPTVYEEVKAARKGK